MFLWSPVMAWLALGFFLHFHSALVLVGCTHNSPGSYGNIGATLCKFIYKHEMWHRCRRGHTELICWGRQRRWSLGPPYCRHLIFYFAITSWLKVIQHRVKALYMGFRPQGIHIWGQILPSTSHMLSIVCKCSLNRCKGGYISDFAVQLGLLSNIFGFLLFSDLPNRILYCFVFKSWLKTSCLSPEIIRLEYTGFRTRDPVVWSRVF